MKNCGGPFPPEQLLNTVLRTTKQETKTIIIARYGLLECGKNYKGTLRENCNVCDCVDDENHRINSCTNLKNVNLSDSDVKLDFNKIYSDTLEEVRTVTTQIAKIWNTHTAAGTMHK